MKKAPLEAPFFISARLLRFPYQLVDLLDRHVDAKRRLVLESDEGVGIASLRCHRHELHDVVRVDAGQIAVRTVNQFDEGDHFLVLLRFCQLVGRRSGGFCLVLVGFGPEFWLTKLFVYIVHRGSHLKDGSRS